MIRRLLIIALAWWGIARILRSLRRGQQARHRAVQPTPSTGRMVRDRVCETFLPANMALSLKRRGATHYFCSEECRTRFLAAEQGSSPTT